MRRIIAEVCFLLVAVAFSVNSLYPQSANPNDALLMKLDAQRMKAISDGDMNGVGALLADDYIHVNADGQILPKSVYFPHHLDNHRKSYRAPDAKVSIRYYGDIAIMVGPQLNDQVNRGVHEYAVTIIWHKEKNGTWKEVGAAYSQVPVPCATARKNDLCRKE
jgi:hypothetical protein